MIWYAPTLSPNTTWYAPTLSPTTTWYAPTLSTTTTWYALMLSPTGFPKAHPMVLLTVSATALLLSPMLSTDRAQNLKEELAETHTQ
eukprot:2892910-Rhodomonas_salina.1